MIEMGPGVYMEYVGNPALPGDPQLGSVYLCEKVNDCPPNYSCKLCREATGKGLEFQGLELKRKESAGWCSNHWRPIHKRDESLIQSLLAPVKRGVKELEPA